jgi:hypothetical protein
MLWTRGKAHKPATSLEPSARVGSSNQRRHGPLCQPLAVGQHRNGTNLRIPIISLAKIIRQIAVGETTAKQKDDYDEQKRRPAAEGLTEDDEEEAADQAGDEEEARRQVRDAPNFSSRWAFSGVLKVAYSALATT